ncbi:aldehyde dehydrogenase family protein [Pseudoalteromonas luteoviolacea]|uniref:Aldehyde dehydrogenase n=1 Tax=Pseudoalteromonas luteoviolacea S4054 TaxID=1129367 RepID=A0A0F6A7S4_9GAMM|nr:aldehyde dehydrogenase family protein [Pseudoalteromonas luteoviolacea]AOT10496.1 hypothetical protein S4054249_21760 [Pseudoalteromonas luteoviolacea]AOT15435.1 hypothetical protein S40542_21835 [Pseudoalteromonas luteoviolacea]AOT20315.1 hypothetical protein S4054_21675 [Pseudoalteromonas luteoviolacea]KKE81444.1 hypothetical protein N479_02890 [Pseudoalteromonas luteoviolacea S4054]KZN71659.1 hypothetical protein N481_18490 [Pseudoalteromonas luteoviolacea S4047-1]
MSQVQEHGIVNEFIKLKSAHYLDPFPTSSKRKEKLERLSAAIIANKQRFVEAANNDFSIRAEYDTLVADIIPTVSHIRYLCRKIESFMKPHSRSAGWQFFPSRVWVEYVPKGVIGIIAPWNYPIQLALVPLATALAAGNKVMIKLSEYTPSVNEVMKDVLKSIESDCIVVEGGPDIASMFSHQHFDHIFFTGSTDVGKQVYAAASRNLVPVTLELGGKSPMIVLADANQDKAVLDIIFAKKMNAGQVCVAPDYVLVEEFIYESFIAKLKHQLVKRDDMERQTGIVNEHHARRLESLIEDVIDMGVEVYHSKPLENIRADDFGMHLIFNPPLDSRIMQEEVFGPILSVIKVRDLVDAKKIIQRQGSPLTSYLYTDNLKAQRDIRQSLLAGSISINDMLLHVAVTDLPFGGVGHSGMGQYHGTEGLVTFSHAKSIFKSNSRIWRSKLFAEYSHAINKLLTWLYLK